VDVQTCQEAGLLGKADEVHFEHAFAEKRAIITNDNDFLKLAAKQTEHYGIVFIVNQRTDIGVIVKRII
jgi:predicted nuclease of predicted toxin-antitoxin system